MHGDFLHNVSIFIAEYHLHSKGFDFLNGEAFADQYKYPGIPDIYVKGNIKFNDKSGRKCSADARYIVEIETHSNNKDTAKKKAQFEADKEVHKEYRRDLIVIPLNKLTKAEQNDLNRLSGFIESYLPEND